ncbi:hypothetical protein RRG08_050166 [Elysia crispata]|uniref:Uncharacterized protein n=1 Tax=Elysia crispata TaxID=231223 RepID=A0AAE0YE10_9GAST|nr:hypothetical protein RRG08_050166 [Elysia crispata]
MHQKAGQHCFLCYLCGGGGVSTQGAEADGNGSGPQCLGHRSLISRGVQTPYVVLKLSSNDVSQYYVSVFITRNCPNLRPQKNNEASLEGRRCVPCMRSSDFTVEGRHNLTDYRRGLKLSPQSGAALLTVRVARATSLSVRALCAITSFKSVRISALGRRGRSSGWPRSILSNSVRVGRGSGVPRPQWGHQSAISGGDQGEGDQGSSRNTAKKARRVDHMQGHPSEMTRVPSSSGTARQKLPSPRLDVPSCDVVCSHVSLDFIMPFATATHPGHWWCKLSPTPRDDHVMLNFRSQLRPLIRDPGGVNCRPHQETCWFVDSRLITASIFVTVDTNDDIDAFLLLLPSSLYLVLSL